MKKTSRIYKSVEAFFIKNKWQFSIDEKSNDMHMEFQGIHAKWICSAHSYEDRNQFVFYSNIPVQVPKEKRMLLSEFLNRANYRQVIGNWEIDLDRGLIRFKTSIDIEGVEFQEKLINYVIMPNVVAADKYLPGIVSVLDGQQSPKEAISFIDNAAALKEDTSKKVDFEKSKPD